MNDQIKLAAALFIVVIFSANLLFAPSVASAQTNEQISQQLKAQIEQLQAQIRTLQQQLGIVSSTEPKPVSVPTPIPSVFPDCPVFSHALYRGVSDITTGGEVSKLQKMLANDPSVYPEGLITGYYGQLTEKAVQRWQAKWKIVSFGSPATTGYGVVGPQTRAKIITACPIVSSTSTPTISLTAPLANTTVAHTITISATASDDIGISKVEFLVDGALKGTDTTAPYSYAWDTTNNNTHPCNGAHTHTLSAKAYDATGNSNTSSTIVVNMQTPSYCTPQTSKFSLNDRISINVGANVTLNIRSTANGTITGFQPHGALGTIIGGPTTAGGFTWWNVNYDTGIDGWSAESYLQKVDARARGADISYGPGPRQKLDVYYDTTFKNAPIAFFIHGGGWQSGDKSNAATHGRPDFFNGLGFVYVTPNYRLSSDGDMFPLQIQDAACALAWIKQNAARYGADPSKVVIMGSSAGAHLAAMITYNPEGAWLNGCSTQGQSLAVQGFWGESGLYDFDVIADPIKTQSALQPFLGDLYDPTRWSPAEPINFISPGDPPALLMHGDQDFFVGFQQSIDFAAALKSQGIPVTLDIIPGYGHTDGIRNFDSNTSLRNEVETFVRNIITGNSSYKR
ncbi:MAG: Ig-like domain-containing protein [bacterium]|nr:Ig-like domain-containing protein [bacterium]MDZ4284455.1 Ig-like domain-containing protein [Patescibacteria group bacterium]